MDKQPPAEGILLNRDFGDAKSYTAVCECSDDSHIHRIWVEADGNLVTVTINTRQYTDRWSKSRWSQIWTLLTKGYIELESDILMREQPAINYLEAIKKAVEDVKLFKKSR